jgi:hypothetical protein
LTKASNSVFVSSDPVSVGAPKHHLAASRVSGGSPGVGVPWSGSAKRTSIDPAAEARCPAAVAASASLAPSRSPTQRASGRLGGSGSLMFRVRYVWTSAAHEAPTATITRSVTPGLRSSSQRAVWTAMPAASEV